MQAQSAAKLNLLKQLEALKLTVGTNQVGLEQIEDLRTYIDKAFDKDEEEWETFLDLDSEGESDEDSLSEDEDLDEKSKDRSLSAYSLVQMRDIVQRFFVQEQKFDTIKNRYRKLPNVQTIYRYRKYVENHGTRMMKLKEVDRRTYEEFIENRVQNGVSLHDRDLAEFALTIAEELHFPEFKASSSWIYRFKQRHRLVDRKITKMVGTKARDEKESIEHSITEFLANVRPLLDELPRDRVHNTDQSGIQLEMVRGRTLDFRGAKRVEAVCQRPNAITHSLTIQPRMNADGELDWKLLVCFFEPAGAPKKFQEELLASSVLTDLYSRRLGSTLSASTGLSAASEGRRFLFNDLFSLNWLHLRLRLKIRLFR